jgi:tRNA dimethylallyltransferase
MTPHPAIQIFGPTASGKSAVAEYLAQRFDLQLLSVDSALVYRGLDIGSAKPAHGIREHYQLIDLCEPEESYSAARFVSDANAALEQCRVVQRSAVLVGGTGLYFRALNQGLSELPAADPALRANLARRLENEGARVLHDELARLDPLAATRIGVNDLQRLCRALEVIELSGQSLSSQQTGPRIQAARGADLRIAWAPLERDWLHRRIEARLQQMFAEGFVEEVRGLMRRPGLTDVHPSMRAVGYRQVWSWLATGEPCDARAQELALYATRQLAKRQFTWLRSETGMHWIDAAAPDAMVQAERLVAQALQLPQRA